MVFVTQELIKEREMRLMDNTEELLQESDFRFVSDNEEEAEIVYERSVFKNLKKNFKSSFSAKLSVGILLFLVVVAILAPLSPYDPYDIAVGSPKLALPSLEHPFGTDDMGRDYFTRALYGGRVSLLVSLAAMSISTLFGTIYGTISGYVGGKVDAYMMRFVDIFMSIPSFLLIVIINTFFTPNIFTLIIVIGLFTWQGVARITRAETLSLKKRDFVLASRALGVSHWWIIVHHIIPNLMNHVIVVASVSVSNSIMLDSSLSFLGYGVSVPIPSWGGMLQNAQSFILDRPLLAFFPGLLILLTILCISVLSDLLRDSLNPKLNK